MPAGRRNDAQPSPMHVSSRVCTVVRVKNDENPMQNGENPLQNGEKPIQNGENPLQNGEKPFQNGEFILRGRFFDVLSGSFPDIPILMPGDSGGADRNHEVCQK